MTEVEWLEQSDFSFWGDYHACLRQVLGHAVGDSGASGR
jgi:hypothetical protein